MKSIYVNNKVSSIENIFEMVKGKSWHQVNSSDVGRDLKTILKEWVDTRKTYYYIQGEKIQFELK